MNKRNIDEIVVKKIHLNVLKEIEKNPGIYPSIIKQCTYSHLCYITKKFLSYGWIYVKYGIKPKHKKHLFLTKNGKEVLRLAERIESLKNSNYLVKK